MFDIEVLQPEDLAGYKGLIDECFGGSNDMTWYQRYQANDTYRIYVVKDGNEIIGSVTQYAVELFTFGFQPCLMIFNVAVKPARRKQKIGKLMMRHVIETAKAEGYHSISLTCLGDAHPAHRLYESVGFQRTGSVKYHLDV